MCRLQSIAMRDYQESVTIGQTDRQTHGRTDARQSDPYVPLCFAGDTKSSKRLKFQNFNICPNILHDQKQLWNEGWNKTCLLNIMPLEATKSKKAIFSIIVKVRSQDHLSVEKALLAVYATMKFVSFRVQIKKKMHTGRQDNNNVPKIISF